MEDAITDDLLDACVGDVDVVGEGVERASVLEGFADGEFGGRHGEVSGGGGGGNRSK